ncbi:MAG: sodium-translocating pyrophosphatase, partial [Thermotogae bacterium]
MLFALIVGVLALLYVIYLVVRIARFDPGNKQIQDLSRIIHKGARSFLFQEYSVFFPVVFLISAILLVIGKWQMAVAF